MFWRNGSARASRRFGDSLPANAAAAAATDEVMTVAFVRRPPAEAPSAASTNLDLWTVTAAPDAASGRTRVRAERDPALAGLAERALDAPPLDPLYYRDRRFLDLPPDTVRSVKVIRGAVTQEVTRAESGAFAAGRLRADEDLARDILAAVNPLTVHEYVVRDTADLARFGLAVPTSQLTLGLRGQAGLERTLLLGGPAGGGGVYATVRGEDVIAVITNELPRLLERELTLPAGTP